MVGKVVLLGLFNHLTEMMTIGATLLEKQFLSTKSVEKAAVHGKKLLIINVLICGAFTNFITLPILTETHK